VPKAQTGWLFSLEQTFEPPPRPLRFRCFATIFDVAATPPGQEG
jgi:hypothetical protein